MEVKVIYDSDVFVYGSAHAGFLVLSEYRHSDDRGGQEALVFVDDEERLGVKRVRVEHPWSEGDFDGIVIIPVSPQQEVTVEIWMRQWGDWNPAYEVVNRYRLVWDGVTVHVETIPEEEEVSCDV